jgi:hypothetical protein
MLWSFHRLELTAHAFPSAQFFADFIHSLKHLFSTPSSQNI